VEIGGGLDKMLEIEQDRCRGVLYGRTEKQEMNQVSSSKGL
jgi:hypothetical protein